MTYYIFDRIYCPKADADGDGVGDICEAAGEARLWGDANCDGGVNSLDALANLLAIAALNVPQQVGCPLIGDDVLVDGTPRLWADEDCSGEKNALDALLILLIVAGLPHQPAPAGCPELGDEVDVSSVAPAARPAAPVRVLGVRVL